MICIASAFPRLAARSFNVLDGGLLPARKGSFEEVFKLF